MNNKLFKPVLCLCAIDAGHDTNSIEGNLPSERYDYMNKILAFAKLDFQTVKPYMTIKNLVLSLVIFGFIGYGTGEPHMLIGMLMMYGFIYASYPFAVGDKNGIDALYATLPMTKRHIVFGRYVFALCLNICIAASALAASAVLMGALGKEIMWVEILLTILICFILFSVLEAIQLPIYFRLGYARAKFLAYLPLAVFPAAAVAASAIWGGGGALALVQNVFLWAEENLAAAAVLVSALWVLIMVISAMLSYSFYKKREF